MHIFQGRSFAHMNWSLVVLALLLSVLGVINLYSAGSLRMEEGLSMGFYFKKQILWIGVGFLCMLVVISFDYRHLKSIAWPLFWVSVGLLAWLLISGEAIYGAKRWINLGIFSFQPTELAKCSILFIAAMYLSRVAEPVLGWGRLLKLLSICALPAGLIVLQPDLGSGLYILLILACMILYKGVKRQIIWFSAILIPIIAPLGWFLLKDYQKARILTFINPERDPLGSGYNIIQSQIAIGSGGLWGKGFMEGTQSQLRFLPEKHTDFVFAVFAEEWGFTGCLLLLVLFCLLLYQILLVIQDSKDSFGAFLAVGVFFGLFWQIFINMAMVLGLMPVVGLPLPFLSYGGSSTLVNFCLLGLVLNVSIRRFVFKQNA